MTLKEARKRNDAEVWMDYKGDLFLVHWGSHPPHLRNFWSAGLLNEGSVKLGKL